MHRCRLKELYNGSVQVDTTSKAGILSRTWSLMTMMRDCSRSDDRFALVLYKLLTNIIFSSLSHL